MKQVNSVLSLVSPPGISLTYAHVLESGCIPKPKILPVFHRAGGFGDTAFTFTDQHTQICLLRFASLKTFNYLWKKPRALTSLS